MRRLCGGDLPLVAKISRRGSALVSSRYRLVERHVKVAASALCTADAIVSVQGRIRKARRNALVPLLLLVCGPFCGRMTVLAEASHCGGVTAQATRGIRRYKNRESSPTDARGCGFTDKVTRRCRLASVCTSIWPTARPHRRELSRYFARAVLLIWRAASALY